ncbi:MAG TPA: DEAD/DEAH box helicase [Ruminococcaceae bacterium]|nr:DEAD/DEAH box helicase [Oscillospiraceae bacterium]HBM99148.1 DEAD/DEAH box helicase [Ruminococcus sp.]
MSYKTQSDLYLEDNISKYPAIELLCKLGFEYISPEECARQRGTLYDVLLKDILRKQLHNINQFEFGGITYKFTADNVEKAIKDLDEPLTDGLIRTSEKIYDSLMLGKSYIEKLADGNSKSFNLKYIDWEHPENNVYHVTEEFSCDSWDKQKNARPDIVLFVNGIPFAVIECKAPTVSEDQAIEQIIRNQGKDYIPQLFKYAQVVVATNKNAVKYATCGTLKKFWSIWREQYTEWQEKLIRQHVVGREPTVQDRSIVSLLSPERLLKLTKYFILYDANVKKICRYQQFFAVEEIIKTINTSDSAGNRQSGVIWHTQGSGKSLTMVMVAKYILEEMSKFNPRVVIVTDRKELDRQIAKTFAHTRLSLARATSGKHLIDLINKGSADVITSIINKFNTVENSGLKNDSRDIFVLVDESHRSNYGSLATKMRTVFPNACYIGFTGTPLMKNEKNTMAKFGKLIHKYTIKDGVEDKAIVPLIYEGKFVDQRVDEENIDLWFEQVTKRLNNAQKADLRNKWSSIKRLTSTDARIKRIALDINQHFVEGYKNTGFKAMLACNYKKDAIRYQKCFELFDDLTTAVVISAPDMREGNTDIDESADELVVSFWNKMMKQYGNADEYEETIKNKFIDGEIDILIVCGKLLTGFDAPRTQVLYIDKELKDHSLLQAIARTNRLYEGKDFGLIVDYRGLISKLDSAMEVYSGSGLEEFDSADIKGVIVDVMACVGRLREAYSHLCDVFSNINNKEDTEEIELYLADTEIRGRFYDALCVFGRTLNMVLNSEKAYSAFEKTEIDKYQSEFIFYSKLRRSVKIRYADVIDNREYEKQMQNLLDTHMSVAGIKQITNPVDILDKEDLEKEMEELGSLRSKADSIMSHMTKSLKVNRDENPAYYDSFSKRIKEALEDYKNRVISEAEYLDKMKSIMADYRKGTTNITYPEKIKGNVHAQAFYGVITAILDDEIDINDNLNVVSDISLEVTDIIKKHDTVDWQTNKEIHNKIAQDIDDMFYRLENEIGFKIDFDTIDKIIENVITVALRRFK